MNNGLAFIYFISLLFLFSVFFYFIFVFTFTFLYFELEQEYDVISYVAVTHKSQSMTNV